MFLTHVGQPTEFKKIIYLIASVTLGLLLSINLHALIEVKYLNWLESRGEIAKFYGGCALPPLVQILILLLGLIGGYYLGKYWWRKVYIERFWEKKKKK